MTTDWRQINIATTTANRTQAEHSATAHLTPILADAEMQGALPCWFYLNKPPGWRLRYLPGCDPQATDTLIGRRLEELLEAGHITAWTMPVYEPEQSAFGGPAAMDTAHRFFHLDSRSVLAYLAEADPDSVGHRRETSILLITLMLREAGLDWYEQGDVWARVAEHRPAPTAHDAAARHRLEQQINTLMRASVRIPAMRPSGALAPWAEAYATTGRTLADLAKTGELRRGLRAILAHHIIFAWNRLGLDLTTQTVIAHAAADAVFGHPDPPPVLESVGTAIPT
jgi:thiopeptide-type bacteriocin biosynthesis protein